MSDWTPLAKIARGVAIASFKANSSATTSVDLGDEVYVVESHISGYWMRGYVVSAPRALSAFNRPLSKENKVTDKTIKSLDLNVAMGVFPSDIIHIKEYFDFSNSGKLRDSTISGNGDSKLGTPNLDMEPGMEPDGTRYSMASSDIESSSGGMMTEFEKSMDQTLQHMEYMNQRDNLKENLYTAKTQTNNQENRMVNMPSEGRSSISVGADSTGSTKPAAPAIPYLKLGNEVPTMEDEPLVDDITSVIKEWYNTYVYHYFLLGNYKLIVHINEAIKDLYFIRRKLMYGLLTKTERIIARKRAIWQICRISKLLKQGIVVREPLTGEIMSDRQGPVKLAQEQVLLALASDYPDHSTVRNEPKKATLPKHILVDFKSVAGSASGESVTVLLYLRTKTQRLTEAFSVFLQPNTLLIDLSAVLFRDLPISITKDDVFLVTEAYEDVPIIKGQSKTVRRGFAAGAADISRLFRMDENVESPFTIRMYTNYFAPSEPNEENRGWGELVDRVIRGRPRGV